MSEITHTSPDKKPHSFGDVDYSNFVPTAEVVLNANKIGDGLPGHNETAKLLRKNGNDSVAISDFLQRAGFQRLSSHLKHGYNAILFEANDNQMIRLVHKKFEKTARLDAPFILQPTMTYDVGDYRIEVLPRVITLVELLDKNNTKLRKNFGITPELEKQMDGFKAQLMNDARNQNIDFWDNEVENIAVVKNKQGELIPLILDASAACVISNESYKLTHAVAFMHTPEYYAAAQAAHLESLGLEQGKIKQRVFSDIPNGETAKESTVVAGAPVRSVA